MSTSLTSELFLNDLLTYFQAQCLNGLKSLLPEALFLVWAFGIILICMRMITQGNIFGSGSWQSYIIMTLKIGVFVFLVTNWEDITINIIFKSFEVAGQTASNISANVKPSGILSLGFTITQNVFADVLKSFIMNAFFVMALRLLMCLVIIAAFSYMAIMFFLVTIEFYLTASLSVILIPFGMVPYLKFLFNNVVSAMFSFGIKYMTMVFILGLGANLFTSWNVSLDANTQWQSLAQVAVGVVVYCVMCLKIPELVSGMIHGAPSHDSGTQMAVSAATSAGGMAVTAGRGAGRYAWNSTRSIRQKGWETTKRGGRMAMGKAKSGGKIAIDKAKHYTEQSLSNIKNRVMGK